MAIQMYLIQPKENDNNEARESIAEAVAACEGFILMATTYGSLIVAFDERYVDVIRGHHLVAFVGGVTLDPQRPGAASLQRKFAENVALQLQSRGITAPDPNTPDSKTRADLYPPGYRPLRWPLQDMDGEV